MTCFVLFLHYYSDSSFQKINQYYHVNFVPDKGLVTNYGEGGATKREGGAREVLPLRKGGAEKVLAMLKGGRKKFRGSFYAVA